MKRYRFFCMGQSWTEQHATPEAAANAAFDYGHGCTCSPL